MYSETCIIPPAIFCPASMGHWNNALVYVQLCFSMYSETCINLLREVVLNISIMRGCGLIYINYETDGSWILVLRNL